jgi:hypothetical protein
VSGPRRQGGWREKAGDIFTVGLTLAALGVAGLAVRNQFFPRGPDAADLAPERLTSAGHWIGSPGAKLVIVELSDFQCPYCGKAHYPGVPSPDQLQRWLDAAG